MYKNLSIAVLLVAFGLVAARSTGAPTPTLTSPTIVRKLILRNQTAPIPSATLFTPATSGLFRISAYMTQISAGADGSWYFGIRNWSDDAGQECCGTLVQMSAVTTPPNAYGVLTGANSSIGAVAVVEAVAGQPVQYVVSGPPADGGTYSLYVVVERLI